MKIQRIFSTIRIKRVTAILLLWQYLLAGAFMYLPPAVAPVEAASSRSITSRIDFKRGSFNNTEAVSKEGEVKLNPAGSWTPQTWKTPKLGLSNGSTIVSDGEYVYLLANQDYYFARYDYKDNSWKTLKDSPRIAMYGADMSIIGDYIYVMFGGWQKYFSRYKISSDTWENLADTPDFVSEGGTITTDGINIYAVRGGWTTDFWKYTPATNTWSLLGTPPGDLRRGSGLVYKNGYLYTPRGDSVNMYRYEIATDNWTILADAPVSLQQSHNIDIVGDYIYITRDNSTNAFYRYHIDDNPVNPGTWEQLANTPQVTNYLGLVYHAPEPNYLYVFRGNGYYDFWKYDMTTNTFVGPPDLPNYTGSGTDMLYYHDGTTGFIYTVRGRNSGTFYRYNLTTLAWELLTDMPADVNGGNPITMYNSSRGVVAGTYMYFMRALGNNVNGGWTFFRYNLTNGAWEQLANTPAYVCNGGALAYTGTGDYIYATRGCGTRDIWRYTISTNTWTNNNATDQDLPDNAETSEGAVMTTDGTNIYLISGYGIPSIHKYTGNAWTLETTMPFAPYWGTDMVWYNGKIYIQAGNKTTEYWTYTPGSPGTWQRLPWGPAYGNTELGAWNGGSFEKDNMGNFYSVYGSDIWKMNKFTVSADAYVSSGTWTSEAIDLTYVASFSTLSGTTTIPAGASVTFQTRTSSDLAAWSAWETVTDGIITSPTARYLQVRSLLSSTGDRTQTPILKDISVTYTGDENAPSNPSPANFSAKTGQVGGTVIPPGGSSPSVSPYFDWPDANEAGGATDAETDVMGYYVHFGIETDGNDITGWEQQSVSNYTVSSSMTNGMTYRFWIKTFDKSGNTSMPVEMFSFVYAGVNPQSVTVSDQEDFGQGESVHISSVGGTLRLEGKDGFWLEQRLNQIPNSTSYGSRLAYISSSRKFYILAGRDTAEFYEYDFAKNLWTRKADAPSQFYYGDLTEGPDGYLYALKGRNTRSFWRYEIATDTWSDPLATDLPTTCSYGCSLRYDGSRYIYALRGNSDDAFYRFDPLNGSSGSWDTTLPTTDFGAPSMRNNNTVGNGGDLAFDGEGNFYAIQGGGRAGFSVYNVNDEMWSILPDLPYVADYGAAISYDRTTNAVYYTPGMGRIFFYKFDVDSQMWTRLTDIPGSVGSGASLRNIADGNIYMVRGNWTTNIYKYNIAKDTWYQPNVSLFEDFFRGSYSRGFSYGSNIIKGDGSNYYITRGDFSNDFVKFNETTGEVTKLANFPMGAYHTARLLYIPSLNRIYATSTWIYRKWWYYSIDTDTWTEITADPLPGDPYVGSTLLYDGSRYIYFTVGNSTGFWRYDFQAPGGDGTRWQQRANVSGSLGHGAQPIMKDGYIYTLRGGNNKPNAFYRYNGTGANNVWDNLSPGGQPLSALNWWIYNTGFLVDGGDGNAYACRGGDTDHCFRYSWASNTWSEIASSSAILSSGTAATFNGTDKIYVTTSSQTHNSFSDALYTYVIKTNNSSFEETGAYTSQVRDLGKVYRFADLSIDYAAADNSSVIIFTRTSSDSETWSEWDQVTMEKVNGTTRSYKINSAPNRYFQVKMDFNSIDGVYTPAIDEYTVNYYQDADPPTNPSQIEEYSTATKSAGIETNTWYNFSHPHFDWPDAENVGGASDSTIGSGVEGYYVYFGTSNGADPYESGTYATQSAFTVTDPLVSGQTYYLRIKTRDNAGNTTVGTWQPFVYKFDNEAPTNPVTISVDPPGYTTVNNYSFTLKGASDSASLISHYCYKYKTGEESYSDEACIAPLEPNGIATVSGIRAYAGGEDNTIYIRSKDNAGNYNPAFATQIYKYSANAPSRPDNLRITYPDGTDTNTINEFAFAWDPPVSYVGQQLGLKYYYWINEKPSAGTAVNSLGLSVNYLSKGAFAQREGKNTLYIVAQDEAGNMDYGTGSYASIDFYSDTSAPGAPSNIDISDVSIKETNAWRLALSWDQPVSTGSGIAEYRIYRSSATSAVCPSDPTTSSDFTYIASTMQTSYVDTGLTQNKKYYCVTACNYTGGKGCGVTSDTVGMYPDGRWRVAPILVGTASATVKTKSALITWSTNRTANSFVKYGKAPGDYGAEVGSSDQVTYHQITLTGLDPGTTYYFKEYWTDEDGNMGSSEEMSLSTNPAPFISSVKVSNVSIYTAYVTFTVRNAIKATIEYGKTVAYNEQQSISTAKNESTYTVNLNKLLEGTKYHLRLVGEDDEGNIYAGDDYTFETLPVPKITTLKVQQVSGMATATLRLVWTSNTAISSIVTYYPSDSPESAKDQISLATKKNHEVILRTLKDDTDYTIVVKGRDAAGNEAVYPSSKVKTAVDFRPPEITNMSVESTIIGIGDDARAQVIVSWDTDELSTTQVEYAQGTGSTYSQTTQEDTSLTTNHVVTITGLSPSKIYHLRAVSKDKGGNISQSPDTVTITPKSTKDALNLVIDNLSKTFGFLKGVKGL